MPRPAPALGQPSAGTLPVLDRLRAAVRRLGLDDVAAAAAALLLESELDNDTRLRLLGDLADKVAPRRRDLIAALGPGIPAAVAAAALTALESRGVVSSFRQYAGPWALAELFLDARVRQFCLEDEARPQLDPRALWRASPRLRQELDAILNRCRRDPARYLVVLRGRSGSGRDGALGALLNALGTRAATKSIAELRQLSDSLEPELSGSAAVWDARRWDPTAEDYDLARRWLRRSPTVCVALLDLHQDAPDADGRLMLRLDLDPATAGERRAIWEATLRTAAVSDELVVPAAGLLGERNSAGAGLAWRAAQCLLQQPHSVEELVFQVEDALGSMVQPSMLKGVIVDKPEVPLSSVIGPPALADALQQLALLCRSHAQVETRGRLGVKALFSGPSGTGKTMAARALACALRRPLYRVDLASVVSRWVGETEKNLRDALSASEIVGAVLLFDEGDSLFGKRGDVEKGSDRYANMEVSYLLQAIEAHAGITIVTTNQKHNLDHAFERRFDVLIDFVPPGQQERFVIWTQELGAAAAELSADLLRQTARRADLSGGSIASAARLARVLAHERGEHTVSEQDLRAAVQSELLKMGSPVQSARWANVRPAGTTAATAARQR